ncbi:MAG: hypothetical protein MUF06_10550 [Pirellulaceae bacterium]|nr:hypothetical protein [Pirellulaceae bacterium]
MLADEARAGWVLVEKFDQSRIRLKRPAAARERDGKLDFDPYRTEAGTPQTILTLAILGGILGFFLMMVLLASVLR